MTNDQREIHRKKRVLEFAERIGNIKKVYRYFRVAFVDDLTVEVKPKPGVQIGTPIAVEVLRAPSVVSSGTLTVDIPHSMMHFESFGNDRWQRGSPIGGRAGLVRLGEPPVAAS